MTMTSDEVFTEAGGEDFDDLTHGVEIQRASLWNTDWTVETLVSQLRKGNIYLTPAFQRRNAWTNARCSLFIESLFLGLPIPQIILAENQTKRGSYIVIDGKQRLLALHNFFQVDSTRPRTRLEGLRDLPNLNGLDLADISADPNLSEMLSQFENASIRAIIIRNWDSDSYLYNVFLRINRGSVQLSPQELRQALYPTKFSQFVDERSANSEPIKQLLRIREPDFRMRDAELLLRYLSYRHFASLYRGNLKQFLDMATSSLSDDWENEENNLRTHADDLDAAIETIITIFGPRNAFSKYSDGRYEGRLNRALFDPLAYYFSNRRVRDAATADERAFRLAFEQLSVQDQEFTRSIEQTTKSRQANYIRFSAIQRMITDTLGVAIDNPIRAA